MSAAEALPWKLSLKWLKQLTDNPSDDLVAAAADEIMCICEKQQDSTASVSQPTCRKLVDELKWPLHACTAIAKAAQQQPKSPGVYAAVQLLETFFSTAGMHCLEAAGSSPVPSLQASVRQQVEQSGLLPQLPALLIAAAVELSAQAKDKSFVGYSQLLEAGLPVPFYSGSIRHHSNHLFKVFCHASMLWSADDAGRLQALAGTCAAAMQLVLAVTRHISAEVQEHMRNPGASRSNSFDMQDMMMQAYLAMGMVATIMVSKGPGSCSTYAAQLPQVARLLQAPQLVPCFALQLTTTALAVGMIGPGIPATLGGQQESGSSSSSSGNAVHQRHHSLSGSGSNHSGGSSSQQLHHTSGTSSGGGGGSNSSRLLTAHDSSGHASPGQQQQQQQQQAETVPPGVIPIGKCPCCVDSFLQQWQLACEWQSSLTPCHHKLFELLGVDARAVLWAAAVNREHCPVLTTSATFMVPYVEHVYFSLQSPLQQSSTSTPRQQLERQLHLLLPAVLMHHAAAVPAEHAGFAELCIAVAQVSNAAAAAWGHLQPVAPSANMPGSGESPHVPPSTELGQLLRLGCALSTSLQQRLSTSAADSAAAAPAAGAAAAAVTAPQDQAVMTQSGLAKFGLTQLAGCMCKLVRPAVWVESVMGPAIGSHAGLAATSTAGEEGGPIVSLPEIDRGMFAVAGLRDEAVAVMAALEGCVRSTGAAFAVGLPPPTHAAGHFVNDLLKVVTIFASQAEDGYGDREPTWGVLVAVAAAAGPGSAAQRQLHGLMISALKLVYGPLSSSGIPGLQLFHEYYSPAAAVCAFRLLGDAGATAASASAAVAAVDKGNSGDSSSLAPGVVYLGLEEPPDTAAPCEPLDQLPWAVLLGRCFLLWAQQLERDYPGLLEAQRQGGQQQTWLQVAEGGLAQHFSARWCLLGVPGKTFARLELCVHAATTWLQDARVADRLSAAGYQPQQVLEPLTLLMAVTQAAAEDSDPIALRALVQTLRAAGQALGCLATPVCCNNPSCSSLVGLTELQSVSGKGCICAGCRTARYCDRACQRAHWKQHKPVCQALAAATAAKQSVGADSSS